MRKLLYTLNRKITINFVISTLATFAFAVLLKFIFEFFYGLTPVRGGINEIDISYYFIILLFRILFATFIEFIMEDKLTIPISGIPKKLDITTLMMDNNTSKSSTNTSNSKMWTMDQEIEMQEELSANYKLQYEMIKKLRELKNKEDIKYFVDKEGNLDITIPDKLTEKEGIDIAKKVGIADRIINTKVAEVKTIEGKDLMSNNSSLTNNYAKVKEFTKQEYDKLFK